MNVIPESVNLFHLWQSVDVDASFSPMSAWRYRWSTLNDIPLAKNMNIPTTDEHNNPRHIDAWFLGNQFVKIGCFSNQQNGGFDCSSNHQNGEVCKLIEKKLAERIPLICVKPPTDTSLQQLVLLLSYSRSLQTFGGPVDHNTPHVFSSNLIRYSEIQDWIVYAFDSNTSPVNGNSLLHQQTQKQEQNPPKALKIIESPRPEMVVFPISPRPPSPAECIGQHHLKQGRGQAWIDMLKNASRLMKSELHSRVSEMQKDQKHEVVSTRQVVTYVPPLPPPLPQPPAPHRPTFVPQPAPRRAPNRRRNIQGLRQRQMRMRMVAARARLMAIRRRRRGRANKPKRRGRVNNVTRRR